MTEADHASTFICLRNTESQNGELNVNNTTISIRVSVFDVTYVSVFADWMEQKPNSPESAYAGSFCSPNHKQY
jgi:hypothetical protein